MENKNTLNKQFCFFSEEIKEKRICTSEGNISVAKILQNYSRHALNTFSISWSQVQGIPIKVG